MVWPLLGAAGLTEYVDPAAAAAEAAPAFIADYEASYEDVARPEWLSMTFERATAHAARELKFLVAYLHAPAHGDTDAFCREALSDGEVLAQLAGGDFVAWGADVSSPDGARLARALRVGRRPVVAIMLTLDSRATLVGMADAQGGAQGLCAALVAAVEEYSAELVVARADAAEMQVSRRLREEQDDALAASLRADQEREAQEAARLVEEAEARRAAEEEEAAAAAAEVAEAAREAEREATITSRNERARIARRGARRGHARHSDGGGALARWRAAAAALPSEGARAARVRLGGGRGHALRPLHADVFLPQEGARRGRAQRHTRGDRTSAASHAHGAPGGRVTCLCFSVRA